MSKKCDNNEDCTHNSNEKCCDKEQQLKIMHTIQLINTHTFECEEQQVCAFSNKGYVVRHTSRRMTDGIALTNRENQVQCTVELPDDCLYECIIDKTSSINNLLTKVRNDCGYKDYEKELRFDVFFIIKDTQLIWLSDKESIEKQISFTSNNKNSYDESIDKQIATTSNNKSSNDKSLEKQTDLNGVKWNFKLRHVAAMYLWKLKLHVALNPLQRVGHLTLVLYDGTYISMWKDNHSKPDISLVHDIAEEGGHPKVLYLEGVKFMVCRQNEIIKWWNKHNSMYNFGFNNCAQNVLNALVFSSFFTDKKINFICKLRPRDVYAYVKSARDEYHKLRDKYVNEYNVFYQLLLTQLEEYKQLEESGKNTGQIFKISYEVIKEQQQILNRYREYDEYQLLEKLNDIIVVINQSYTEKNTQKNHSNDMKKSDQWDEFAVIRRLMHEVDELQYERIPMRVIYNLQNKGEEEYLTGDELNNEKENNGVQMYSPEWSLHVTRRLYSIVKPRILLNELETIYESQLLEYEFDLKELNIKPLKFKYDLMKQIKNSNQLILDYNEISNEMLNNGEENVRIGEKYGKFLENYQMNAKKINRKIEANEKQKEKEKVKNDKEIEAINEKLVEINIKLGQINSKIDEKENQVKENNVKIVTIRKRDETLIEALWRDNTGLRKEIGEFSENYVSLNSKRLNLYKKRLVFYVANSRLERNTYYANMLLNSSFYRLMENTIFSLSSINLI